MFSKYEIFFLLSLLALLILSIPGIQSETTSSGSGSLNLSNEQKKHHKRCGGVRHSTFTRPCPVKDTMCGHWKGRHFHPVGCHYQDITSEQARKCLGNRTLAFIGDSQIRDISVGVAMFLLGQTLEEALDEKFDTKQDMHTNGTRIADVPFWGRNVPGHNYNGHIFPKEEVAKEFGYTWQVQVWSLFRNEFVRDQVEDVLNNKIVNVNPLLRKIDFAFWSHGLHDAGYWWDQPYGERYFNSLVSQWIKLRNTFPMPTVWVSMNPECDPKLKFTLSHRNIQAEMVEDANYYVNHKLLSMGLPYWDAAAALRVPERCNFSDDGVHVKMFVDIMRAKMLFNHLCDSEMNWRGDLAHFI